MSRVYSILGVVIAIAIIAVGGWAVVRGIDAEPSVVGSLATALGAIIAVLVARNREQRERAAQSHREAMSPIYEQLFIEVGRTDADDEDRTPFFEEVHRKLVLNGPTPVVKAWLDWLRTSEKLSEDDPSAMRLLLWERVLFAIREDLGHNNDGLKAGDLLRLYINDSDEPVAETLSAEKDVASMFRR